MFTRRNSARRPGSATTGLTAAWSDRVRHALRPGWARSQLVRRIVAALLVLAAAAAGVRERISGDWHEVVVAATALRPGAPVTGTQVRTARLPPDTIPEGALRATADALGATVTGPVTTGEVLTTARLLSSRLPERLTGDPRARLVPVKPADDAVASLLRVGDAVDVIAGAEERTRAGPAQSGAETLAEGAIVALVPENARPGGGRHALVLLAMGRQEAAAVAAASLTRALTVVLR